jgi:hypothetical protein
MTSHDMAILRGSKHVIKPRGANTQSRAFPLLVVCFTTLIMLDTSNYCIEECLVGNVWVHEGQHTGQMMNQVMTAFQQRFGMPSAHEATRQGYESLWRDVFMPSFR